MRKRTLNGETYLDSKTVLDTVYEALKEEVPDPPKGIEEAVRNIGGYLPGSTGTEAHRTGLHKILDQFPNEKSFRQAVAHDGYTTLASADERIVREYYA